MLTMGRPKIHAKDLPQHMRLKGKSYYHVYKDKWTPLGSDLTLARIKWAELEGVDDKKTFSAALDKYLASKDFDALSDNSKVVYLSRIKILRKAFGHMKCSYIKPTHIYAYLEAYKSAVGGNQSIIIMRHALERARMAGWVEVNAANKIKRNKTNVRTRYITDDEFNRIYESGTDTLKAVMKLHYLIGQRPCDIMKIHLNDISEEGIYVQQQKTKAKQLFVWTEQLRDAVKQAKALPRPVRGLTLFCNTKGKPYGMREFRCQWIAACKIAGVEDAQWRDLRAKAATDAENTDQDYQSLLGHTSKAMSDRYVKRFKVKKVQPLERKIREG
jgi:integrase